MIWLYNANIFTQNPKQPVVSDLIIQNGRVLFAGSHQEAAGYAPNIKEKFDLSGKTVLPGLCDAHMHLEYYALFLQRVDCETDTLAACLERVAERAQKLAPNAWVMGHGWNQNIWDGQFGTAQQLDQAAGGRPVILTAKSYHAMWVSSAALKLAGITRHTPDPEGGKIGRDANGEPDGNLFETAMQLMKPVMPEQTVADSTQAIFEAQTALWKMGITAVHDFDRSTSFGALQELDKQDRLRLRVNKSIPLENMEAAIQVGLRTGFGSDYLKIGSIKMFADGALGPQTAAMFEPYDNSSTTQTGILLMDSEALFEQGQKAVSGGFSMAIHAIGDRANHEMINGLAQIRRFEKEHNLPALRHRIEHVQILHPQDVNRLAQLGIIASVQPLHATSDMDIADKYWGKRSAYAYAYNSLLQAGTTLAFGSDAPVESPNPFYGLHAAVTRRRTNGYPDKAGWYAQQKLNLQEAINGFTSGAAFAAGRESELGQLTAGYFADLIVIQADPFKLDPQDLWSIKPEATMVAGRWVWTSNQYGND